MTWSRSCCSRDALLDAKAIRYGCAPMPALDSSDQHFVRERESRQTFGLFAFPAAIVLVCLVWVGLFSFAPLVVNPFDVLGRLERGTLAPGTLTMFAVVGVLAMNAVFLLMLVLAASGVVLARRERRYLKLIEKLTTTPPA